jgi:hypothetical protein
MKSIEGSATPRTHEGVAGDDRGYRARAASKRFVGRRDRRRAGLKLNLDIYEPRDFSRRGAGSCNMCGGIVSESLVQNLASEGLKLPVEVLQRRIDSYYLHMDAGSVRIPTPLEEKRIASVHRGPGPRTFVPLNATSFDDHLLRLASRNGARVVRERVRGVGWNEGRPEVEAEQRRERYDLVAVATGVNGSGLKFFDAPHADYAPPERTKAYISEFYLGQDMVRQCFGSSMHVFLLDIPRIDFAAMIPKSDYVTVCLLGHDLDRAAAERFLAAPEVRKWMPPLWEPPKTHCHCSPRLNVGAARQPWAERVVFVGDSGATKLYKDGIGTAYRCAKAAAVTAVFEGVSAADFERHYGPTCRAIEADNRIGRMVFGLTRQIQKRPFARRAVWKMVRDEQEREGREKRMSGVLWDVFTGSAHYKSVVRRSLHPAFVARLAASAASGQLQARKKKRRKGRAPMAISTKGVLGKQYKDGDVIYRQGEPGDCMYLIQEGKARVLRREGNKELCIAELGENDFFGELAVFEKENRSFTVRAVGDVSVSTLQRDSLLKAIHQDPSLAYRLIQQMAYRIRDLELSLIHHVSEEIDGAALPG